MRLCGRKTGDVREKVLRLSGSTNYGDLIEEILPECLLCARCRISFCVVVTTFQKTPGEQISTSLSIISSIHLQDVTDIKLFIHLFTHSLSHPSVVVKSINFGTRLPEFKSLL